VCRTAQNFSLLGKTWSFGRLREGRGGERDFPWGGQKTGESRKGSRSGVSKPWPRARRDRSIHTTTERGKGEDIREESRPKPVRKAGQKPQWSEHYDVPKERRGSRRTFSSCTTEKDKRVGINSSGRGNFHTTGEHDKNGVHGR